MFAMHVELIIAVLYIELALAALALAVLGVRAFGPHRLRTWLINYTNAVARHIYHH